MYVYRNQRSQKKSDENMLGLKGLQKKNSSVLADLELYGIGFNNKNKN